MKLLEDWTIMKEQVIRLHAPSDAYVVLGYVYSHDAFQDGDDIVTTAIVKVDARNIVTTKSGTLYALGTPARVGDRIPDAREVLEPVKHLCEAQK